MIENESEQLYQELRRKLQDYGSAPPESVWAGIREQVPARQPRNWRPLLLLLLLGFIIGSILVGKRYWPTTSSHETLVAKSGSLGSTTSGTTSGTLPLTTTTRPGGHQAGMSNPGNSAAVSSAQAGAAVDGVSAGSFTPQIAVARTRTPQIQLGLATRAKRNHLAGTTPGIPSELAPVRRPTKRLTEKAGLLVGAATHSRRTRYAATTSADGKASGLSLRTSRSRLDVATSNAKVSPPAAAGNSSSSKQFRKLSNAPLALLVVRPASFTVEDPEVRTKRRPARKRPSRRELRLRNWSGEVLVGQSITYRFLGGSPTQLEQLERPGMGFSGQISGAYAFSRQLTVSAGLGYAEYANTLRYQLKKSSSEAIQQQDFRDVYRFFTIPVQAQLTLGGNPRWRYGVLGGGTAAFLTGARTTVGSACNCRQREWSQDMPDSLFSRTNLALTGGTFVSYQFALGQWLTIRPQANVFLNSLTGSSVSRTPRRPWNLGVQLGYSWDLDPRKH